MYRFSYRIFLSLIGYLMVSHIFVSGETKNSALDSSNCLIMLLHPGLAEGFDCRTLEKHLPLSECFWAPLFQFDKLSVEKSHQVAINDAVQEIETYLQKNSVDLIIAGSRGAGILTGLLHQGIWSKASLFLSPIIKKSDATEEDNYDQLVRLLYKLNIPFLFATGSSTDEEILINEPIREALERYGKNDLLLKFVGDHGWYVHSEQLQELIKRIRSLVKKTCYKSKLVEEEEECRLSQTFRGTY